MKVNDAEDKQPSVRRRSLLRGGAVLAGAGLAGTALAQPASAAAAAPGPVVLGADNVETTATGLTVGADGDADVATLRLTNADGPSLYLNPLEDSWNGSLQLGEIANTNLGPLIGVGDPTGDDADNPVTTFLATGVDLEFLPTPLAVTPVRLVDTRTAAGRKGILASSAGAFTADFKLRPYSWVDVLVAPAAEGGDVPSVFVNLTAVKVSVGGYLSAYPPGTFPGTSTLNVAAGQTLANGAFVATGTVGDYYAVRIYSTAECWIVVDLTGAVVQGLPTAGSAAARRANRVRQSVVKQMVAKIGRRR
jgi:hypothetical protein